MGCAVALTCAAPLAAQQITTTPLDQLPQSTLPWSLEPAPLDNAPPQPGTLRPLIEVAPLDPAQTDGQTEAVPEGTEDRPRLTFRRNEPQELPKPEVAEAGVAIVRALDKVNGAVETFELAAGQSAPVFRVLVSLRSCRYPVENPAGEAYAWLDVETVDDANVVFSGWMIASSPALSAMDHPRYDVWVLRCKTS
jgi:hypothetical protein